MHTDALPKWGGVLFWVVPTIYMGASAKDPPLKLTSMLIGISINTYSEFFTDFFFNELRNLTLSSF